MKYESVCDKYIHFTWLHASPTYACTIHTIITHVFNVHNCACTCVIYYHA